MYIQRIVLLALVLLSMVLPAHPTPRVLAQEVSAPRCFPDVPGVFACIDPALVTYWERNGGLAVFGYPLGSALPQEIGESVRTVQLFERNQLEIHPEAPTPYQIQLGRLGAERLAQSGRAPAPPVASLPDCRFFALTGHTVCGDFRRYWEDHGLDLGDPGTSERESLALLGLPLGEAALEVNGAGDRVITQWFERARLEQHGERVLLGLLGVEIETAQIPAAPAPGFVEIDGTRLVQNGMPIMLKGLNYYPAAQPWGLMWQNWDAPAINGELLRARRDLGINVVRVLIPFRWIEGWTDGQGNVQPVMLGRLQEFVQMAGSHQIKVLLTLFDWHDSLAPQGSPDEASDLRYLRTIVDTFKDDDRVFAWDLHNEPDHYPFWGAGRGPEVVDWLGRMADAIRAIDTRHPLTVGVGKHESLWLAAPNGRTVADMVDFISVHGYDAARLGTIVDEVRARSAKPILLEEFGWPTGPECRGPYFDEPSQLFMYREAMRLSQEEQLIGLLSWWFQDPPAILPYGADENGHYGLYRRDGGIKPAAGPFRGLRVPALPSTTRSAYALTVAPPRAIAPENRPLMFDDGMVIRESFQHFWTFFGGEATFGRPITLAYRDPTGKLVQYFERARFELNESEHVQPIDPNWPEGQTPEVYLDRVHLTPLGAEAIAGQTFPSVPDPVQPGVDYFPSTGHTLSGAFRELWETRGEIFFGAPLSEPFDEIIDGRRMRVQYFTYWRFEQEGQGPVRLAVLGRDALQTRQCPRPY